MPAYKAYPTVATTPMRSARKHARKSTFAFNQSIGAVERRARRDARKAAKEAAAKEAEQKNESAAG